MPYTAPPMIPTRQGAVVTDPLGTLGGQEEPDSVYSVTVTRASVWMSSVRDWLAGLGFAPLKP